MRKAHGEKKLAWPKYLIKVYTSFVAQPMRPHINTNVTRENLTKTSTLSAGYAAFWDIRESVYLASLDYVRIE